jgi:hypothetical protein
VKAFSSVTSEYHAQSQAEIHHLRKRDTAGMTVRQQSEATPAARNIKLVMQCQECYAISSCQDIMP